MKSSVVFAYTHAKTAESQRLNLLANTSWVTSESYQVSLPSRQAKIGSKQFTLLPKCSREVCAPSLSFHFGRLSYAFSVCHTLRSLSAQGCFTVEMNTKKLLWCSNLLHGSLNGDRHQHNHSLYISDEVIQLNLASTAYTSLTQGQAANDIFLVKL